MSIKSVFGLILLHCLAAVTGLGVAATTKDVANTLHNLSAVGPAGRTALASSEDQVCVFCHTPHGATIETGLASPLWNRAFSTESSYVLYDSSSLDALDVAASLDQPGGSSKLCLSCHDGTLAIGTVNVLGGQQSVSISMAAGMGTGGIVPPGEGVTTGFTRNLGVDLTNDHPISVTYNTTLATNDGEMIDPSGAAGTHIAVGAPGSRPPVPLEATGSGGAAQVQCATCHDPHITDPDVSYSVKFLRLNRFQKSDPGASFSQANDIICLGCHDKAGWETSAHAIASVAAETYKSGAGSAAELREFPSNIKVWEAACLNCHDTHTVHGARRLLREGTDDTSSPKQGGGSAIEETCYQCHTTTANTILNSAVPNIETEFTAAGTHMPITTTDQQASSEAHDILDADFTESTTDLGKTSTNRHAECTDCHNPHRLMKSILFNDNTTDVTQATHDHSAGHDNIASGVLRGTWGVEPNYSSESFFNLPSSYTVKKGDAGLGASTAVSSTHVTREYQICLKCHSDYGYTDNNVYPTGNRPNLGDSGGGTTSGTNDLTQYTNQAREFQAPAGHKGTPGNLGAEGGAHSDFDVGNHRSWHPVMDDTGRTTTERDNLSTGFFESPWNGSSDIGNQTMYCSDCHGAVSTTPSSAPASAPWGPHGSSKDFLLRGDWDNETGTDQSDDLCFKCHDYTRYAAGGGGTSGFSNGSISNLHAEHHSMVGTLECSWCHIAIPHGWKNKAFLVNLNDIGPEAGQVAGTGFNMDGEADTYTQEPYYLEAKLKVLNFKSSGAWGQNDCGSQDRAIMIGAGGNLAGAGSEWMTDVCDRETP